MPLALGYKYIFARALTPQRTTSSTSPTSIMSSQTEGDIIARHPLDIFSGWSVGRRHLHDKLLRGTCGILNMDIASMSDSS
ncbi:hypothetical protein BYT27DRAFT_7185781 [Phlegmacium glaucopus]|nr:hypothetical protein BYT27DRAFT_7185781 [Phlegmacium glaucopus]